jgi:hypothetical protein
MGKTANRLGALGFFVAASAVLLLPGTASADTADPMIAGSCDATLRNEPGQALTVDTGAPVNAPGVLTVGTGTDSAPVGPAQTPPLLSVPLADAARTLGVGNLPVVGPAVTDMVCPGVQNTANALSAATQSLVSGQDKQPAPPSSTPPAAPKPPAEPSPVPVAPSAPAGPATGLQFISYPVNLTPPVAAGFLTPVTQAAIAPAAPALTPPTGTAPTVAGPDNVGSAQAMPASSATPAKLPLLLAAVALALAGAALAHTWLRRTTV